MEILYSLSTLRYICQKAASPNSSVHVLFDFSVYRIHTTVDTAKDLGKVNMNLDVGRALDFENNATIARAASIFHCQIKFKNKIKFNLTFNISIKIKIN